MILVISIVSYYRPLLYLFLTLLFGEKCPMKFTKIVSGLKSLYVCIIAHNFVIALIICGEHNVLWTIAHHIVLFNWKTRKFNFDTCYNITINPFLAYFSWHIASGHLWWDVAQWTYWFRRWVLASYSCWFR